MINKPKKRLFSHSNWKQLSLLLLLSVSVIIIALELTGTTYLFHKRQAVSGVIPSSSTKENKNGSNETGTTTDRPVTSPSADTDTSSEKSSTAVSDGTAPLISPYGSFVSNHKPSYSGAGNVPSKEQSVCITTPGASCYITFVNNENITKKLESKVADSKGAVYWDWDVKEAGFTVGTWKITATASLNGQTKTTSDSMDLMVVP